MTGRTIPAFVVADHLNTCMTVAAKGGDLDTLKALLDAALAMELIAVNQRHADGTVKNITWLVQPENDTPTGHDDHD